MTPLRITVHGTPAPQGSKRHVGHGILIESSTKLPPWREAVRHTAELAAAARPDWTPDPAAPLAVTLTFTLPRPAHHHTRAGAIRPTAPPQPHTRPDLDKLIRATLDGLVDSGAIHDDSRITTLDATKTFPGNGHHALPTPGAVIVICPL